MVTYSYAYMTYIVSPLAGLGGGISWRPPARLQLVMPEIYSHSAKCDCVKYVNEQFRKKWENYSPRCKLRDVVRIQCWPASRTNQSDLVTLTFELLTLKWCPSHV